MTQLHDALKPFNEHFKQEERDFEQALHQRRQDTKNNYLSTERLSAEPRGNEIDLRRKAVR